MFKPSTNFTDCSKVLLLLWILFVIYASCLSLLYCHFCSLQLFDRQLGKGSSLGSLDFVITLFFCNFPIWCVGSGVLLG